MSLPTFSVLLGNYNKGSYIKKTLQAVLSQSLCPDEIIIIDDCSTDNSVAIIKEILKEEPKIRFIQNEKNMGACYTLNRIVHEASCDYFHLVGTDDLVLPGFYEKSMKLVSQYPQAGLCSAVVQCYDIENKKLHVEPSPPYMSKNACYLSAENFLSTYISYGCWYNGAVTFWRREPYMESGGFAPAELGSLTDTYKFFEMGLEYGACFIPEDLHTWTVTSSGFSGKTRLNPERSLKLITRVEEIMINHPRSLFPSCFVEEFKRRELATFGNAIFDKMDSDQNESLSFFKQAVSGNNVVDRLVIGFSKSLMWLQKSFLKIYLGFRLRRFNGVFLMRMIYHVKDCVKKLIK